MSNQVARNSWNNYNPPKVDEIFDQDPDNVFSITADVTSIVPSWVKKSGYTLFNQKVNGTFECLIPGYYRIETSLSILRTPDVDTTMATWITLIQNDVVDQHRYGEVANRFIDPTDVPGFFTIGTSTTLYLDKDSVVAVYLYSGEGTFSVANGETAPNNGATVRFSLISQL